MERYALTKALANDHKAEMALVSGPTTEAALISKHVTRVMDAQRHLAAAREELRHAHRKLTAANGVCPDCRGAMTIDLACEVSDPPHDGETRTAPSALCGTCECCVEL